MVEPISLDSLREKLGGLKGRQAANLNHGGGGGTMDGMEARVALLERSVEKMDLRLEGVEKRLDKLDGKIDRLVESVAEMKGRVMASPTTWQLLGIVITTWTAGAAIVFALGRGLKP